jgi:hypothetical protein
VFGDAISSFNPIYGQGMSVAALQAVELAAALRESPGDLARRFFRRAAKVVDMPWSISVGNDLRMPETVGRRNAGVNFVNWYMTKLHKAAHSNVASAMAFLRGRKFVGATGKRDAARGCSQCSSRESCRRTALPPGAAGGDGKRFARTPSGFE